MHRLRENSANFKVSDVVLPKEIAEGRAKSRRELRAALDRMALFKDRIVEDPAVVFDESYQQGFDLVSSPKTQAAFGINREDG